MSSIYVVMYSFIHNYTYHMYVYIYIMQWDSLDTQSESFILIYL